MCMYAILYTSIYSNQYKMKRVYLKPMTNAVSLCGGQVFLAGSEDSDSGTDYDDSGINATISGYEQDSDGGFTQ